jgi:glycosyltransferase involved in cell wall biosynthesis
MDPLRLLFVTLEFVEPIFSGNGVYSRSLVRILSELPNMEILVVCGRDGSVEGAGSNDWGSKRENVDVVSVPLGVWRKLDRSSAWEQFAAIDANVTGRVRAFRPQGAIGVDWTSVGPHLTLQQILPEEMEIPWLYFNFRVYSASTGASKADQQFYKDHEREAVELASSTGGITVALCQLDKEQLEGLLSQETEARSTSSCAASNVQILMPPLRYDVQRLAMAEELATESIFDSRQFITCCARLTEEKNVMHYVAAVSAISAELQEAGIIPYLIGSPTDPSYAEETKNALKRAFPGELSVVSDFQPPEKLSAVFRQTRLNVHPALYEAYGMTVAEAAAFGAPTLLDGGGGIGVAGLLPPPKYAFATNMKDVAETAAKMKSVLGLARTGGGEITGGAEGAGEGEAHDSGELLAEVAAAAKEQSLSWGEQQLGDELSRMLLAVLRSSAA